MKLTIIRHGQTDANINHICQGQTDGLLNEKGKQEAAECCAQIGNRHFDAIYCSDLYRAVETANIIFTKHQNCHIKLDKRLRERYFGDFQGKTFLSELDYNRDLEGAETMDEMYKRVTQFLLEIESKYQGKSVALISHGITIRVIKSILTKKAIVDIPTPQNCSETTFEVTKEAMMPKKVSKIAVKI